MSVAQKPKQPVVEAANLTKQPVVEAANLTKRDIDRAIDGVSLLGSKVVGAVVVPDPFHTGVYQDALVMKFEDGTVLAAHKNFFKIGIPFQDKRIHGIFANLGIFDNSGKPVIISKSAREVHGKSLEETSKVDNMWFTSSSIVFGRDGRLRDEVGYPLESNSQRIARVYSPADKEAWDMLVKEVKAILERPEAKKITETLPDLPSW